MKRYVVLLSLLAVAGPLLAGEGMWRPGQLPELADNLRATGLEIAPEQLSDLTDHPMNAVISLGGCTASFVSRKGELIGLIFDGNWESIISDWDFLPDVTRSIHVDIRYVLWVMEELDGAGHLLEEMGVAPPS